MVNTIGWGSLIFIIGFGSGRLRLHAVIDKIGAHTRSNKNLSTEQLSNLLFGIYVGLAVTAIQKSIDAFDISHGPGVSAFLLAVLALLVALIIQFFFLNKTNAKNHSSCFIADEIEKLASLQKRGLLSQKELESQKSKLMDS